MRGAWLTMPDSLPGFPSPLSNAALEGFQPLSCYFTENIGMSLTPTNRKFLVWAFHSVHMMC